MAIDTAERRRAVAGIPMAPFFGLTPNASKDAEWRQHVAWGYSGIAAGSPAPVPVLVFFTAETFAVPAFTGATFRVPALDTETFTVPAFDTETWND